MPTSLPTQHERDPVATTPLPTVDATLHLSTRTLSWLARRPQARLVVESVWDTLAELEAAGHHPRLLAALRFVLIHHAPTVGGAMPRLPPGGLARFVAPAPVSLSGVAPGPGRAAGTPRYRWFPPSPSPGQQVRPVTGTLRWAMSPLDFCVHLVVSEGGHPPGVLTAGRGLLLLISGTTSPDHRRLAGPGDHTVIAQEVCGDR